jgi:signal transduction histidine kinase
MMSMPARPITHRTVLLVLVGGFACVILLLLAGAFAGVRSLRSIQENAASLLREQALAGSLIDELQSQQGNLTEVFSVLARDPDSVNFESLVKQLDEADRDIARIAAEGARTPERDLWSHLEDASKDFSAEARRLLSVPDPETFASIDLFRLHERFVSLAGRLMERSYRKVNLAQREIDARSRRLVSESILFLGASLLPALVLTGATVRLALGLTRRLEAQAEELSRVSWHMLENQETTARRFSHELHDELGQSLTAVKTSLGLLDGADPGRLHDCLRQVDEAIGNVRQLSQLLRPTILDDFGLEAGLRWLCEGFSARTGLPVHFDSTAPGRLPDETETHLFRIAQEALTNVARHAHAKRVDVRLERSNGEARLTIRDDGCGLPGRESPGRRGLGLIGMRARARSFGGAVEVRSRPGEGVLIEVRAPVADETHSHSAG